MGGEDRSWAAFKMRRDLINVEVLSGEIDGPTFTVPCDPLTDMCCQVGPRIVLLMSAQ